MTPEILHVDPVVPAEEHILRTARVLAEGGVIAYPTETVYGLGADALNAEAVMRVHAVKGREERKPLILLADSRRCVLGLVGALPAGAEEVMRRFWPGPLTLVLPAGPSLPDVVTAGTGTIGVRVPGQRFCREVVRVLGRPIVSTSANRAGEPTPPDIDGIVKLFGTGLDLYVDGGTLPPGPASTLLDLSRPVPVILRDGAIPRELLRELLAGPGPAA